MYLGLCQLAKRRRDNGCGISKKGALLPNGFPDLHKMLWRLVMTQRTVD